MQKRFTAIVKTFQELKGSDIKYTPLGSGQTKVMVTCPNPQHLDLHPSCQVDLESGNYYCYGCGNTGSVDLDAEEFKM